MRKLSIVIVVIIVFFAGCIQVTPAAGSTIGPVASLGPSVSPVLGPPPALPVVSDRAFIYDNEHIDVDIHCPEISGMFDPVLQQYLNERAYYDLRDQANEIEQAYVEDPAPVSTYYIESVFTVRRNDGVFLSISEEIEYYNGGANIGSDLKCINVKNAVPGQLLALGDIFRPGVDYTGIINGRISDIIAASPEMADFWFTTISDNQGFYLTDTNLVIAFQDYDIAPGASGPQEFSIPLAELGGDLIPELS